MIVFIGDEFIYQPKEARLLTKEECINTTITYIGWNELSLGNKTYLFRCIVYGGVIIEPDGITYDLKKGFWANNYNKKSHGRRVWIGEKPTIKQREEEKWIDDRTGTYNINQILNNII